MMNQITHYSTCLLTKEKAVIGMGVLDEYELADSTIKRLKKLYECPIYCKFDGTPNKLSVEGVDTYLREWMYGKEQAGRWTHDFFTIFLENYPDHNWLIKVDPDSLPILPLTRLPNTLFGGTIANTSRGECLYGGVFIIHRLLVKQIVEKRLLLGNKNYKYFFTNKTTGKVSKVSSQDAWITKALRDLKVEVDYLEELGISPSKTPPPVGDYAFIHPVYLEER